MFFLALPMLGAGIALWFMGPAWFHYRENTLVRAISIGLIVGAPILFFAALFFDTLAGHIRWSGGRPNKEAP
ncbi:MAG: hypothetical protein HY686_01340 [Chloroflexi bacterium]|nr:hypothetical protein [Chloroflexota bacterium]